VPSLLERHALEDRLVTPKAFGIRLRLRQGRFRHPRQHLHDLLERAQLLHLLQLLEKVLQREVGLPGALGEPRRIALVHRRAGLLHQPEHITHPQDARGEAVGMKHLQTVQFLAYAHEQDGLTRHLPKR
jgi:hypothetical protein